MAGSLATAQLSNLQLELVGMHLLGEGILKGLAETAKNFAGSFVSKERLTTVEYPEERLPLPEACAQFSVPGL